MAKTKNKPAFPAKVNAMGYENGLTKLEFIAIQIMAAAIVNNTGTINEVGVVLAAKKLLEALEAESKNV